MQYDGLSSSLPTPLTTTSVSNTSQNYGYAWITTTTFIQKINDLQDILNLTRTFVG